MPTSTLEGGTAGRPLLRTIKKSLSKNREYFFNFLGANQCQRSKSHFNFRPTEYEDNWREEDHPAEPSKPRQLPPQSRDNEANWYRDDWFNRQDQWQLDSERRRQRQDQRQQQSYQYHREADDRYITRLRSPSPERPRWTNRDMLSYQNRSLDRGMVGPGHYGNSNGFPPGGMGPGPPPPGHLDGGPMGPGPPGPASGPPGPFQRLGGGIGGRNGDIMRNLDRATLALREAAGIPTTGGRLLPKPPPEAQKPVSMLQPTTPLPLNQMGRLSRGNRKLPQIPANANRNGAIPGAGPAPTSAISNLFGGFAKKMGVGAAAHGPTAAGYHQQQLHQQHLQQQQLQQQHGFMPHMQQQQQAMGMQHFPQQQQQPPQQKKLLPFSFGFGKSQTEQQQQQHMQQQQQQRMFQTAPPLAMRNSQSFQLPGLGGGLNSGTGRRPGRGAKLPQVPMGVNPGMTNGGGGGLLGGLAGMMNGGGGGGMQRRRQLPDRGGMQSRSLEQDYNNHVNMPLPNQQPMDTVVEAGRGVRKLPVPMVRTGTNGGMNGAAVGGAPNGGAGPGGGGMGAPTPFEQMLLENPNLEMPGAGGPVPPPGMVGGMGLPGGGGMPTTPMQQQQPGPPPMGGMMPQQPQGPPMMQEDPMAAAAAAAMGTMPNWT